MRKCGRLVFFVGIAVLLCAAVPASAQAVLVPGRAVDGRLDGPQRYYWVWLPAGEPATVSVRSEAFVPYLVVLSPGRRIHGQGGPAFGDEATLAWTAGEDGWYTVVVTSPGGTGRGAFNVALFVSGAVPGSFSSVTGELFPGVPVEGELTEAHHSGSPHAGAAYRFAGREGDAVSIRMASDEFDSQVILLDPDGNELARNDDSQRSLDSEIVIRLPASGAYTVVATSAFWPSTGRFTLRVQPLPELYIAEGELVEAQNGAGGASYHEYLWRALPGAEVELWLQAEFDAYLEVFDAYGRLVGADDDSGGYLNARLSLGPLDGGEYYVRVRSSSGEEAGAYTLSLWSQRGDGGPGSAAPPVRAGGAAPDMPRPDRAARRVELDAVFAGRVTSIDDAHSLVVELPESGGTFDVWLFAEIDLELFGDLGRPVDRNEAPYGSERPDGYEHIRVEAPAGVGPLYLLVAPYDDPGEGASYWVLVQESGDDEPRPRLAAVPGEPAEFPLAGSIRPGVRYSARIDAGLFETQFWVLEVPEGVKQVRVGLFNADGDLDLSIAPGWFPSPWGIEHEAFSITVRENERISIGAPGDVIEEVVPGVYTIAVWPAESVEASYEIEAAFDAPLPPSSSYAPPGPGALASMSPLQKAQFATVRIENFYSAGSGTILTPDGLILTNYHVIAQCTPMHTGTHGCSNSAPLDEINTAEQIVSLTDGARGYARQAFVARVVGVLPEYDLALIEIAGDLDGNPVTDLNLPAIPVDARELAARPGDDVIALGYPSIARLGTRAPISLSRGIVSGVTTYRDRRIFLQTDARISSGNSGGALVRLPDGALIGIPSDLAYSETGADVQSFARPASLIPREWLDLVASRGGTVSEGH